MNKPVFKLFFQFQFSFEVTVINCCAILLFISIKLYTELCRTLSSLCTQICKQCHFLANGTYLSLRTRNLIYFYQNNGKNIICLNSHLAKCLISTNILKFQFKSIFIGQIRKVNPEVQKCAILKISSTCASPLIFFN